MLTRVDIEDDQFVAQGRVIRAHGMRTVWITQDKDAESWSYLSPSERMDKYWERGMFYRIPMCCIAEFVRDRCVLGQHPFLRRGSFRNQYTGGRYVPCTECRRVVTETATAFFMQEILRVVERGNEFLRATSRLFDSAGMSEGQAAKLRKSIEDMSR